MQSHKRIWWMVGMAALLVAAWAWASPRFVAVQAAEPAEEPAEQAMPVGMQVIYPVRAGETRAPLAQLAKSASVDAITPSQAGGAFEQADFVLPKALNAAGKSGPTDPAVVQSTLGPVTAAMPTPLTSFDGNDNLAGVLPPDPTGDIGYDPATGAKYYVQAVNLQLAVWDVTDLANPTLVMGPVPGNSLWTGFGGICETNNDGDPIVLFDHLAQRWIYSQFALDFGTPEFHQCIAVSQTADPTGGWYLYDYFYSNSLMNDYPKFGVWPDAYYMSVNQFDAATFGWAGAGVVAFERDKMLLGDPTAAMIYVNVGAVTLDYGGMLPADLDGDPPPAGTPGIFIEWDDSTWLGDPTDTLRIWEFVVDWANPSNSTFGLNANYDPNYMVATADVDPDMCGFARNCIPQPGGTNLDAISDRLMYRAVFRVLASGEYTLLSNHTVDADGTDHAGIHWFELRYDPAAATPTWNMYQEGVYAPDSNHRWMASIAMDKDENIALGFSISSTTTFPSVYYAGRLASDPLGQMSQGEAVLVAGGGSQSHSSGRWGDYSTMSVDPLDNCTFWYTQEYYAADSSADWVTRIGAFRFPSCTTAATGSLAGTVTDAATSAPIANAQVTAFDGTNTYTTYTDASGNYAFATLPVGTYDVTAEAWGYNPSTVTGVTIIDGSTTTQDFALTAMPMYTITFQVFDSTTAWPLYAMLSIGNTPYVALYTNPETGEVQAQFPAGTYNMTVSGMWPGYVSANFTFSVSADATLPIPLDADLTTCEAPGYAITSFFSEDFNAAFPPAGWSVIDNVAGGGLVWLLNTDYGDANYTGGDGTAADVNSDANSGTPYDTELITPVIDPTGAPNLVLSYLANYQDYVAGGGDTLALDISTDGGTTWTNILTWDEDHGTLYDTPGELVVLDLTPYLPSPTTPFQLRWHYYTADTAPWDWYAQIDDVIFGRDCVPVADGLVFGAVQSSLTGDYFGGLDATVDDGVVLAQWIAAGGDPATPPYLYVIGEPAGSVDLTAADGWGYYQQSATVTVNVAEAVRQDFALPAASLSFAPTGQDFTVYQTAPTGSGSADLENAGTIDAPYDVFAVRGPVPSFTPLHPEALEETLKLDETPKDAVHALLERDARNAHLTLPAAPQTEDGAVAVMAAGDLVTSWNPGLAYPWGIEADRVQNTVWVGDLAAGGGADEDHEYAPDGTPTGNIIPLPWVGVFAADMAYNPFTNTLWQINVGGDYCIYELDPIGAIPTGRKVCPDPALSLRGLAFDPLTNTFIAGTWNYGGYVFRIDMEGRYLEMVEVSIPISGLAFNPGTGHLFALANVDGGGTGAFDIYVLDPQNDYAIIGVFDIKDAGTRVMSDYGGAGLGAFCDGTLWAVDQSAQQVLAFDSGETGWCDYLADWLTATPATGLVSVGGADAVDFTFDMTGKPAGTYYAHLQAEAYVPHASPMSGVTVTVLPDNDSVTAPVALGLPDSTIADTTPYTFVSSDPVPSCVSSRLGATAWYTVTPAADGFMGVDTALSDYDTVVAVYTGTPGSFVEQACGDDEAGQQSHVSLAVTAGTTYYIMVGAKNEGAGGNLHLHVATFTDVRGDLWAWSYIEALRQQGISGYSDGTYRPANYVTRAQMAKFILLAKYGPTYTPPSYTSYSFSDIDGTGWADNWIEAAAREGIVGGYTDGTYRPNNLVTRAQMTKFILLAKYGAGWVPPVAGSSSFSDVSGVWTDWIEAAYNDGIVGGYPDGTYRPSNPVTRAQMAKFLSIGLGLTVPTLLP